MALASAAPILPCSRSRWAAGQLVVEGLAHQGVGEGKRCRDRGPCPCAGEQPRGHGLLQRRQHLVAASPPDPLQHAQLEVTADRGGPGQHAVGHLARAGPGGAPPPRGRPAGSRAPVGHAARRCAPKRPSLASRRTTSLTKNGLPSVCIHRAASAAPAAAPAGGHLDEAGHVLLSRPRSDDAAASAHAGQLAQRPRERDGGGPAPRPGRCRSRAARVAELRARRTRAAAATARRPSGGRRGR